MKWVKLRMKQTRLQIPVIELVIGNRSSNRSNYYMKEV